MFRLSINHPTKQLSAKSRHIVCIKIPSFPVAIERIQNKALRDRPIVVAQSDSARSRCLALSDEANRMGIRIGNTVGEARKKCRDLIVREPNLDLYRRAQEAIGRIAAEFSPLVEPSRSGRYYLDITGSERLFGAPRDVAEVVRQRITDRLTLPADAGLAGNKLVSRIASFDATQSDLIEVSHGTEKVYLSPHRVEVLPAVIKETKTKLFDLNIRVVEQVNKLSNDLLLAAVGPTAFLISRQSLGIDPSPVTPPGQAPHIILTQELSEDSNDRLVVELALHNLALDGILRLSNSGSDATELSLSLTYSDQKRDGRLLTLPPHSRSGEKLLNTIIDNFCKLQLRRVRIRRVELDFRKLVPHIEQGDLWSWQDHHSSERKSLSILQPKPELPSTRMPSLLNAMNLIRTRFGSSAIAWGT